VELVKASKAAPSAEGLLMADIAAKVSWIDRRRNVRSDADTAVIHSFHVAAADESIFARSIARKTFAALWARLGPAEMSAIPSLSDGKRTLSKPPSTGPFYTQAP